MIMLLGDYLMNNVSRVPASSPYSKKEKIRMALWWAVEAIFFRPSLHKMNGFRCFLLRLFGAKIGNNTFIHSQAKIWFPWNLNIGANSGIGFDALIYNLDSVSMGDFVTVSHRVQINTASHDYTKSNFPLVLKSVTVESGVFIGTESYISPGVVLGEMCVIGARSVVVKSVPARMVAFGHPCKSYKSI